MIYSVLFFGGFPFPVYTAYKTYTAFTGFIAFTAHSAYTASITYTILFKQLWRKKAIMAIQCIVYIQYDSICSSMGFYAKCWVTG